MTEIPPSGSYTPPPPPPPPPAGGGGSFGAAPPAGAPPDLATVRVFFLVSLIVNSLATLGWLLTVMVFGASTCGIGCLLIIVPVVPVVAIVLDAQALSRIGQPPTPAIYANLKLAAIMDIVSGVISLTAVPLVMGILSLVSLGKPDIQRYYGVSA